MIKFKTLIINILFFFVLIEIFSFFSSFFGLLPFSNTPTAYMKEKPMSALFTEKEEWGAWHKKNFTAKFAKSCFEGIYKTNEIGARDTSFQNIDTSKKTFILIGDSFAEGYGVNLEHTTQYILEKKLNINVLNFGTSYDFGPVQYYIIFNKLAKNYKNDGVILFFLPDNDFRDNNPEYWKRSKRHRPYYIKKTNDKYDYFIPEKTINKSTLLIGKIENFIKEYFWSSNLLRAIVYEIKKEEILNTIENKKKNKIESNNRYYSGYFDPSLDEQKAAVFFIKKILNENIPKNLILVTIPRPNDIKKLNEGRNLENLYWYNAFKKLEKDNVKFTFVDLIDYLPKDFSKLFFKCDGHWSPEGNLWAADVLINQNILKKN